MNKYCESEQSRKLMMLNAYYKDCQNNETGIVKKIQCIKDKLGQLKRIFRDMLHLRKVGLKKIRLKVKAFLNPGLIKNYELEYSFDHSEEINYNGTGKMRNGKIAVYTSIFGGYDSVLEPLYTSDQCDYFIITDQEIPEGSIWKKISLDHIPEFQKLDNYHKAKYCKLKPHVLFPDYEYSIWVDGNVQIVADMIPLIDRMDENHVMATFQNPVHDCIFTEANFLIYLDAVDYDKITEQLQAYRKEGFPQKFGMREFSIIVRKHTDKGCISLMDEWWKQVNTYTMRDQISFPYVLWKNGKTIDYIQLLGPNWRHNPRFIYFTHNWRIKFSHK